MDCERLVMMGWLSSLDPNAALVLDMDTFVLAVDAVVYVMVVLAAVDEGCDDEVLTLVSCGNNCRTTKLGLLDPAIF
jgi:hypothetical protein